MLRVFHVKDGFKRLENRCQPDVYKENTRGLLGVSMPSSIAMDGGAAPTNVMKGKLPGETAFTARRVQLIGSV
jgi:hypothetical protein